MKKCHITVCSFIDPSCMWSCTFWGSCIYRHPGVISCKGEWKGWTISFIGISSAFDPCRDQVLIPSFLIAYQGMKTFQGDSRREKIPFRFFLRPPRSLLVVHVKRVSDMHVSWLCILPWVIESRHVSCSPALAAYSCRLHFLAAWEGVLHLQNLVDFCRLHFLTAWEGVLHLQNCEHLTMKQVKCDIMIK